jgi:endonuclease/exonuclease/phosphatase (EEP) superfamily protein YafD
MQKTLIVLSWVFIVATLLPFLKHEAWWIRVFDFPRTQILVGSLASIVGVLWVWDSASALHNSTLVALSLCTAHQFWEMLKYTRLRRAQSLRAESSDPERRIRVLIANVLMTNRETGEYLKLIADEKPDVIVLAETDRYWEERLRGIEDEYPYTIKCPLENTYGLLLYSRLELSEQEIRFRVQQDVPSFLAVVRLRNGDLIDLHCIHPRPPHLGVDSEPRDAELVLVAREVKGAPRAVIVTGDLNDVAWSHTTRLFLRISGLLDPRVGRMFCNTFHASYPVFRWPLDHLFHSRAFRLVELRRLPKTHSDHFPVLVELSYEPEVKRDQEHPVPSAEDTKEAHEKIDIPKEKDSADPGTEIQSAN